MDESSVASATGAGADASASLQPAEDRLDEHSQPHGQQQGNCDAISPAQRFFTDGLQLIFSFLGDWSFAGAFRCCRHWSAAGATMPLRKLAREINDRDDLRILVNSTLARHVRALHFSSRYGSHPWLTSLSRDLPLHHHRLPNLTDLHIDIRRGRHGDDEEYESKADKKLIAIWTQALKQLPSTLRKMSIDLLCLDWRVVDWALEILCESGLPLTSLRFGCSSSERGTIRPPSGQIPVSTLRRLLRLKESLVEFELSHSVHSTDHGPQKFEDEEHDFASTLHGKSARWTQEHIDVFRQLTLLEQLDPFGGRWSDEEIIMLAAEPPPAHLRIMPLDMPPITPEGIDAFVRLPLTLVAFDAFGPGIKDLSFLGRMTTLDTILIDFSYTLDSVAAQYHAHTEALVGALARCTQLTRLDLTAVSITNEHLCRMLPSLTSLRQLSVCTSMFSLSLGRQLGTHQLGGLSFASTVAHLARTLEELTLSDRDDATMPLEEVRHLHALTNLRSLNLNLPVPPSTPKNELAQVNGELDLRMPTFRRDIWPLMKHTSVSVAASDSDGR